MTQQEAVGRVRVGDECLAGNYAVALKTGDGSVLEQHVVTRDVRNMTGDELNQWDRPDAGQTVPLRCYLGNGVCRQTAELQRNPESSETLAPTGAFIPGRDCLLRQNTQ